MIPRRSHRPTWVVLASLFGIGAIVVVALFLLRPTLDVTLFKRPVENVLTEVIEGTVTVERVTLRLGPWLELGVFGLRVESTGAEVAVDFADLEEAHLRIGLLPLFRRELRIGEIAGSGLDLRLHVDREERGNWPVWRTFTWDITRLEGVELTDIRVHYRELSSGREIEAEIDRVGGGISMETPLTLEAEGSTAEIPFTVSLVGGTLAELDGPDGWPFDASLASGDLRLDLSGRLPSGNQDDARSLSVDFSVSGEKLDEHPAAARLDLPELGAVRLSGRLGMGQGTAELTALEGVIGRSDLGGELRVSTGEPRPRIAGSLSFGRLDLAPWIDGDPRTGAGGETPKPVLADLEDASLSGLDEALLALDADLSVTVDRIEGLPLEVTGLTLAANLEDGLLEVPLSLRQRDSDIEGRLRLDVSGVVPVVSLTLEAGALRSDNLATLPSLSVPSGIRVGRLRLAASSSGRSAADHLRSLSLDVESRSASATLSFPEATPWPLLLDAARLTQAPGGPLRLVADGRLAGEAFAVDFRTRDLASLVTEAVLPFTLDASGSGAKLALEGSVATGREGPSLAADVLVSGEKIGRLATWTGVAPGTELAYALEGGLAWSTAGVTLRLAEARLGRTALAGTIALEETPGGAFLTADLQSPYIDAEELLSALGATVEPDMDGDDLEIDFDRQILPTHLHLGQGDVDLSIEEVTGGERRLVDVVLPLRFRDGMLERSDFTFGDGLATYRGAIALDLRSDTPVLDLELDVERAELERFLEKHEQETGVDFTARRAHLEVESRGSTLGEILTVGRLVATLDDLDWNLVSKEEGETFSVRLEKATFRDSKEDPLEITASGTVEGLPISLALRADTSLALLSQGARVPLELEVSTDGTELALDGFVTLPLGTGENDLTITLEGDRLDRFSPLVGMKLPAFGPYGVSGEWRLTSEGDRLSDMRVRIGRSELEGGLVLTTDAGRPHLELELVGERVMLEDLLPATNAGEVASGETPEPAQEVSGSSLLERLDAFVTEDLLGAFDARALVGADELIWGGREIGGIEVQGSLTSGRLEADLVRSAPGQPASRARLALGFRDGLIELSTAARLLQIDYGLVDRILGGKEDVEGALSTDFDLHATAPTFAALPAHLGGTFAFADFPRSVDATILDLWGGQILRGILPALAGSEKPRLNCTVARMSLTNGRATTETLFLDSTRSRIRGKGWVDLGSRRVDLVVKPKPKQRGLINLATTVRIRGDFDDPNISFTAGGITETFFRLYLWFWTIWRELLLRRPLPADGSDICVDPPAVAFAARDFQVEE